MLIISRMNSLVIINVTDQCGVNALNMTAITTPIYLSTPNYPQHYPPSVDCIWTFFTDEGAQEPGGGGTYAISIFDLETEWWDNLMIGLGQTVGDSVVFKRSLWHTPKTVLVDVDGGMWIRFLANDANQFRGFLVQVDRKPFTGR